MKRCLNKRDPIRAARLVRTRCAAASVARWRSHQHRVRSQAAGDRWRAATLLSSGLPLAPPRLDLTDAMLERLFGDPAVPVDPYRLLVPGVRARG